MHRTLPAAALLLALAACQAAPMAAPAQNFVAATNALAQAESDYFDQIQAASDQSLILTAGARYVRHTGSFSDIAADLAARDDFSHAKAIRLAAIAQLQNYAQQIAAIANAAGGTWVADDAKSTTNGLTGLLKDTTGTKLTTDQAGAVQSAVTALGNAIVNAAIARELQNLAVQARAPIAAIANLVAQDELNIETDNYASGLVTDQRVAMLNMLHAIYADPRDTASDRFAALTALQDWHPALVTKGKDIADAMAKLTKANEALAAERNYSAAALAQQALANAQAALATPSPAK